MNPNLVVDRDALLHNLRTVQALARGHGVAVSLVVKGLAGHKELVRYLVENGADSICDTRVQNLAGFEDIPAEKWLIRSPLISEAGGVLRYADVSLVSEMSVLEQLSEAAACLNMKHKVVLMLELGELREGCMPDELLPLCEAASSLPGLELYGVGTNFSCFNEIVPDEQNMAMLGDAAKGIERALGLRLPVISGGNSSSVKMLAEGRLPAFVNHLRIGEAVLLGNIPCYDEPYEGARTDAFTLNAEVIEVKEKPSLPWGERAPGALPVSLDPAYKNRPSSFAIKDEIWKLPASMDPSSKDRGRGIRKRARSVEAELAASDFAQSDRGIRKRALIALGKLDVSAEDLIPLDPGLEILGGTSDCLITDVTGSDIEYIPGGVVSFRLRYSGLASAMASPYIEKTIV